MSGWHRHSEGSAAVEMALALPILMVLLVGSVELGNYFQSQHILEKGLRDGAIYISRQDMGKFSCAANTIDSSVVAEAKKLIQKSVLSATAADRLPNWSSASTYTFTLSCPTSVTTKDAAGNSATQGLSGIYAANSNKVPVVTITVTLPYALLLGNYYSFRPAALNLNAQQQAVVMGI